MEPDPVLTRLAVIETKIDQVISKDTDHEARIRRLERALWMGIGFAAALGSAVGSFVGQIPTP